MCVLHEGSSKKAFEQPELHNYSEISRSLPCVTVEGYLSTAGALVPVQGRENQNKEKAFS